MAAPNEDTVVVVGGLGTQADKNSLNGGGATKVAWDAGSPSDFIGTNGGTITADTAVTYTNGTTTFSKTGIGTGVTVGTLAYVSGTNITAGIYEITARTNDTIVCANIDAIGDNTDSVVNVGGALDTLQNALDNDVNDAALYNRYIYDNIATDTLTATVDVDTNSGSTPTRIYLISYNSTLSAETENIITTNVTLINGLLDFNSGVDYMTIKGFDFNGGGVGKAEYCIKNGVDTSNYDKLIDCKLHNADSHGMLVGSSVGFHVGWNFINCEVYENGKSGTGGGLIARSAGRGPMLIFGCSVHDNPGDGIFVGIQSFIFNSIVYDNGGIGIKGSSTSDRSLLINNTVNGNGGAGFSIDAAALTMMILNNTSTNNVGVGYDFGGTVTTLFFGFNHSFGNSAHYSEGADGTFADFAEGNNKTGDPLFTNTGDGTEDFTPTSGSDLIDNALDAGTA